MSPIQPEAEGGLCPAFSHTQGWAVTLEPTDKQLSGCRQSLATVVPLVQSGASVRGRDGAALGAGLLPGARKELLAQATAASSSSFSAFTVTCFLTSWGQPPRSSAHCF